MKRTYSFWKGTEMWRKRNSIIGRTVYLNLQKRPSGFGLCINAFDEYHLLRDPISQKVVMVTDDLTFIEGQDTFFLKQKNCTSWDTLQELYSNCDSSNFRINHKCVGKDVTRDTLCVIT